MSAFEPLPQDLKKNHRFPKRCRARLSLRRHHNVAVLVIVSYLCFDKIKAQQPTCTLGGQVFQAGEPLGDQFTTRCGPTTEFPCFCDPNISPPINCPYCGIATQENEAGIVCARIDGPLVTVVNLDGELEDCNCLLSIDGNPESNCLPSGTGDAGFVSPTSPPATSDDVCTLEWADGSTDVFQDGESYGGLYTTRCGPPSEYPCYCDVSLPEKLLCPYCSIVTSTGEFACGRIGETIVVVNEANEEVSCSCANDLEADCIPTSAETSAPTTANPTLRPTLRPSIQEVTTAPVLGPSSTITPTPMVDPTPTPTVSVTPSPYKETLMPTVSIPEPTTRRPSIPTSTVDKPSILLPSRTPPISVPVPGCDFFDENTGEMGFVETGEELDISVIEGPCSPKGSFPVMCNPALPGGVEYPYCIFTGDGQLSSSAGSFAPGGVSAESRVDSGDDLVICAKNGDQVTVPTSRGTIETCTCLYLNPFIGPVSSCADLLVSAPLALTPSPSVAPSPAPSTIVPTHEPSRARAPSMDEDDASSSAELATLAFGGWLFWFWLYIWRM